MNKFERKLKEIEAGSGFSISKCLEYFRVRWVKSSFMGSACFVNITFIGGKPSFECYINGESFDKFVKPAMEQAMKQTLEDKRMYLNMELSVLNRELEGESCKK
ncbi:MAG: hypothetical protein RRY36_09510 [Bacteroidaceae bacterium]